MGYFKHHAIVLTSWKDEDIGSVENKLKEMELKYIGPGSSMNGYITITVIPDGSKEGWPESERGDKKRKEFIDWLKAGSLYVEWAEISYSSDDRRAVLIDSAWGQTESSNTAKKEK